MKQNNGNRSSLYTTPAGEPVRSVEEWAAHYKEKTWKQIVNERPVVPYFFGLVLPEGGPSRSWRYVRLKNEKILDMRHLLVVGMKYGVLVGVVVELGQYFFDPPSANQAQDYYSNSIGAKFLQFLKKHSAFYQQSFRLGSKHDQQLAHWFSVFAHNEIEN